MYRQQSVETLYVMGQEECMLQICRIIITVFLNYVYIYTLRLQDKEQTWIKVKMYTVLTLMKYTEKRNVIH